MGRAVVPINNLSRRLPTLGRIRLGMKVEGKKRNGDTYMRPSSIDTFRFTSHDREALEQVASIYGGTVREWKEPKADPGQFEVITTANELRVVLPPDPLGGSPVYEHWTGGGCDRRCDGLTCTRLVKGPEGIEPVEVHCLCDTEGALLCDVQTRLSVILPDVRFGGVWMLATKGWDAAQELPGMVDLLASMQDKGLTVGLLRLEQRHKVTAGETHNYPVPVLALEASMNELAEGAARYGAIGANSSAPAGEIEAGEAGRREAPGIVAMDVPTSPASDDEVVDAELVDDIDTRSLADVLPSDVPPAKALTTARRFSPDYGIVPPTALDQITDYRLIARVLDELGCTEVVG